MGVGTNFNRQRQALRKARRPQSLTALVAHRRETTLPAHVRILGLDPGSIRTGYAVVETKGPNVAYVVSGAIRTQGETFAERLQEIENHAATIHQAIATIKEPPFAEEPSGGSEAR